VQVNADDTTKNKQKKKKKKKTKKPTQQTDTHYHKVHIHPSEGGGMRAENRTERGSEKHKRAREGKRAEPNGAVTLKGGEGRTCVQMRR